MIVSLYNERTISIFDTIKYAWYPSVIRLHCTMELMLVVE
jgi:hypothetical protein